MATKAKELRIIIGKVQLYDDLESLTFHATKPGVIVYVGEFPKNTFKAGDEVEVIVRVRGRKREGSKP